jgi:hypothetical protein
MVEQKFIKLLNRVDVIFTGKLPSLASSLAKLFQQHLHGLESVLLEHPLRLSVLQKLTGILVIIKPDGIIIIAKLQEICGLME